MPRTEYPRWRRVVMQLTLWGLLGVTILLAWWVGRARAAALRVTQFVTRPFSADVPLYVQVPKEWRVAEDDEHRLEIVEPESAARAGRRLIVTEWDARRGRRLMTAEDIVSFDIRTIPADSRSERFTFLGSEGILVELPAEQIQPANPFGGLTVMPRELVACTVLAGERIAVTVELEGPHQFTSGDHELVEAVARMIKLQSSTARLDEPGTIAANRQRVIATDQVRWTRMEPQPDM